jgi:hypothetical protein
MILISELNWIKIYNLKLSKLLKILEEILLVPLFLNIQLAKVPNRC